MASVARIAAAALALGLAAAPLGAQVATVTVFEPVPDPSVSDTGDARITVKNDFALYEPGSWYPRVGPTAERQDAGAPVEPFTGFRIDDNDTRCEAIGQAPPRLLKGQASAGRRAFWPLIARAECRYGLPPGLMDSVILAESRYDPAVVSPAGAAGLSQLMPGTAVDLGVLDRFDPSANVRAGARYLRQLLDSFDGNVPLALAAYNAGPTAVRRVKGIPLNGETPGYVRRVLGYWTAPGIGPMSPMISARQTAQMLGFSVGATN